MKENNKLDQRSLNHTVIALATLIECMYSGILCLRVLGNWRSVKSRAPKHDNLPQFPQKTTPFTCNVVDDVPKP